jgi:tRNA dimethylallyltransferase
MLKFLVQTPTRSSNRLKPKLGSWLVKISFVLQATIMHLTVILGPTCSGKTSFSLKIANRLPGAVVVNCDSRQIYKHLNIGTAKISGQWQNFFHSDLQAYFANQIPHFLIDWVDPKKSYSLINYLQDWSRLVNQLSLYQVENVILCGGTGLWAKAVVENYQPGLILPDFEEEYWQLKQNLQHLNLTELQQIYQTDLAKNNHTKSKPLNPSDFHNPRRIQNWILRHRAELNHWTRSIWYPSFQTTQVLAIRTKWDILRTKIATNVHRRIRQGLLTEVENLLYLGQSRLFELGLEYRLGWLFIHGQLTEKEWIQELIKRNIHYAKRQLTWLKKQSVQWVEVD